MLCAAEFTATSILADCVEETRQHYLWVLKQHLRAHQQEERDAPVDVQIGPQLYERAPQELRSRLWMALLDNPTLATSVKRSAVRRAVARLLQPLVVSIHQSLPSDSSDRS